MKKECCLKQILIIIFLLCRIVYNVNGQGISELEALEADILKNRQSNDTLNLSRAYYKLGKFYDKQGNLTQSNIALKKALQQTLLLKNDKGISSIANYLAANYSNTHKDSAFYYYDMALQSARNIADSSKMCSIMINISSEYSELGDLKKATDFAVEAITIKEKRKDSMAMAYYYQKLGELYKMSNEYDIWEKYVLKAYRFMLRHPKYAILQAKTSTYNDLGGLAEYHNKWKKALCYYDTLEAIGKENNYNRAISTALTNKAIIYKLKGHIDKALQAVLQAESYIGNNDYRVISHNNILSELYAQKKLGKEALRYGRKAFEHKSISSYRDEELRALKNLSDAEKIQGNYKKSLYWHEKYKKLSDSLLNKEMRTHLLDVEAKYQTEKKQQEIEVLTAENKLKTERINTAIILVTILILLLGIGLYIYQMKRKQAVLKQENLRQQVLRSQMNPHFLFNVLGSIHNFMLQNNQQKASNYLTQFSKLVRATLQNSALETISLEEEIDMLENYMALEQMQTNFKYQINYSNDLEKEFIQIPPMLIQPFVENAIRHGVKNIEGGKITLTITEQKKNLKVVITDNGNGLQQEADRKQLHESMAMTIFEERRKLLQRKYRVKLTYKVFDLGENATSSGVKVVIELPVISQDKV